MFLRHLESKYLNHDFQLWTKIYDGQVTLKDFFGKEWVGNVAFYFNYSGSFEIEFAGDVRPKLAADIEQVDFCGVNTFTLIGGQDIDVEIESNSWWGDHGKVFGFAKSKLSFGKARIAKSVLLYLSNFPPLYPPIHIGPSSDFNEFLVVTDDFLVQFFEPPCVYEKHGGNPAARNIEITQLIGVSRKDAKEIDFLSLDWVCEAIELYLSFVRGNLCKIVLVAGIDESESIVFEQWRTGRADLSDSRDSCFNGFGYRTNIASALPCFFQKYADKFWQEVLSTCVRWFVDSNGAKDVQDRIVLSQTCMELLASVLIEEGLILPSNLGNRRASDNVSVVIEFVGISNELNAEVSALESIKDVIEIEDRASALTYVRNKIVHPTKKNRKSAKKVPPSAMNEASNLSLQIVELCILKLIGYIGPYFNRVSGKHAKDVPWSYQKSS